MLKSNKFVRKILVFLLVVMMAALVTGGVTVNAASYPLLVPDQFDMTCNVGDEVELKYTYMPAFNNERIDIEVMDSAGQVVATSSRQFSNKYSSAIQTYTVTWDTSGYKAGEYKVVAYKHFYSLYRWNTAPTTTTRYVTITCTHNWDAGTVTKEPTVFETGVKTYTCVACEETKTEELPVIKCTHTWDKGTTTKKATVFEKGIKTYTCTVCDKTKTKVIAAKSGDKIKYSNGYFRLTGKVVNKTAEVAFTMPVNKNKTSIIIPDTIVVDGVKCKVTSIAKNAFKNNKKVKKVVIGNNVKTINANAFSGCTKLSDVTIGKNVSTIGDKAFYKCTALKKVVLPSKVSKIGKQVFDGCKNLKTITIKTEKLTSKSVGSKAFNGINKKATVKVPKKSLNAYKKLLKSKGVASSVKITK